LSKIYKIRNVWKLPSPFSRNTLISSSEKTSWSLLTSFWKKNCQTNSKMAMKNFSHEKLLCKSLNFMVLGHPSKKSQTMETFTSEKFSWTFLNLMDNFSSKMMFLNYKKSPQTLRSEYSLRTDLEVFRHFLFYRFETN
jgi:hypothetical protein